MSRSVNLDMPEDKVASLCLAEGIGIYSLKPLPFGGTRAFCKTEDGADELRLRLQKYLIN